MCSAQGDDAIEHVSCLTGLLLAQYFDDGVALGIEMLQMATQLVVHDDQHAAQTSRCYRAGLDAGVINAQQLASVSTKAKRHGSRGYQILDHIHNLVFVQSPVLFSWELSPDSLA
jgi:hypothetical protein